MPEPTLTVVGGQLYESVAPLATEDAEYDWPLATYATGLALLLDEPADLSRDRDDGTPGWAIVLDPDLAPLKWLPWLAQFKGATIPPGLDEAAQRIRVRHADGADRGSIRSLVAIAQQFLTGTRSVYFQDRVGGDPDVAVLTTLTSETPNPDLVLAAITADKPGGLVLTHALVDGGDFDTLRDTHSTFDAVTAAFGTFDDLRADPAHS